jgi:hypothetical protein
MWSVNMIGDSGEIKGVGLWLLDRLSIRERINSDRRNSTGCSDKNEASSEGRQTPTIDRIPQKHPPMPDRVEMQNEVRLVFLSFDDRFEHELRGNKRGE